MWAYWLSRVSLSPVGTSLFLPTVAKGGRKGYESRPPVDKKGESVA